MLGRPLERRVEAGVGYVEIEEFSLQPVVSDEAFARLDDDLQVWSYRHREGLRRRTTARGAGREVLVVTLFGGDEPPSPAPPDAAPVAAFIAAADPATYRRATYRDRG